jgi:C4-type Zn-finger protein
MAYRSCPNCGDKAEVTLERITVLPGVRDVASPRWDCPTCGWSRRFDVQRDEHVENAGRDH